METGIAWFHHFLQRTFQGWDGLHRGWIDSQCHRGYGTGSPGISLAHAGWQRSTHGPSQGVISREQGTLVFKYDCREVSSDPDKPAP